MATNQVLLLTNAKWYDVSAFGWKKDIVASVSVRKSGNHAFVAITLLTLSFEGSLAGS